MAEASHPQNLVIYSIPWIILMVTIVIQILHYLFFASKMKNKEGTEELLWWSMKERIIHLILMITFLIIVITGLVLAILPGAQSGIMSFIRKLHSIGPIYGIAALLMLIVWIRYALFKRYDLIWLLHVGGYLGYKGKLKSGKFNAGQKLWFWMVIILGAALVISGARIGILESGPGRDLAALIHLIGASIMLAMLLVHVYMSIFVVKGTWSSIFTGKINKQTAQKLHPEAPEFKKR